MRLIYCSESREITKVYKLPNKYRGLIGQKRGVYICTPMCASARVAPSNIVYLWYGYRSMGISALNTEIGF